MRVVTPCPDENVFAAFVEHRLSDAERDALETHVAGCVSCGDLLASLSGACADMIDVSTSSSSMPTWDLPPILRAGTEIGRYRIVRLIGAGAMGVVYAARDRELDREIALKLLRGQADPAATALLLREARAMAQLSHRNVITVHDVGVVADQPYVAMELVDGVTLREWSSAKARTWREVLTVFIDAARGLAAAHSAGLVHRDFKPDNVLIDRAGRACVTDFGLAEPVQASDEDRSGARPLAGTPAYMAPEQLQRLPLDARADQFSFCVALYEALGGARPFSPETLLAIAHGERALPKPPALRAPRFIVHAVERGLSLEPADRFADMNALVSKLANDPAITRRKALSAVGVLVLGASLAFGFAAVRAHRRDARCSQLEITSVWNDKARDTVRAAFDGVDEPYAASAFESVARALDHRAERWLAGSRDACRAAADGEQTQAVLDLRLECYAEDRKTIGALVGVLSHADDAVVQHAAATVDALPSLRACSDVRRLLARPTLPRDPALRARVGKIDIDLAEARILRDAGKGTESDALVTQVLEATKGLSRPDIEAAALGVRARLEVQSSEQKAADTFARAIVLGEAAGDDEILTELWTGSILAEENLQRFDRAEAAAQHARAYLSRLDAPVQLVAELETAEGMLYLSHDEVELARPHFQRAFDVWQAEAPESLHVATALYWLSFTENVAGHNKEGAALGRRALERARALLGPTHPRIAKLEANLAVCLAELEDPEASAHYQSALSIEERVAPDSMEVATTLRDWATSDLLRRRKYVEAQKALERSLAIIERTLGPDRIAAARTLTVLADAARGQDHFSEALRFDERALAIEVKELGPKNDTVVNTLLGLATTAMEQHAYPRALGFAQRALDTAQAMGANHPSLPVVLDTLGVIHWSAKQSDEAVPLLERALALRVQSGDAASSPTRLAVTRYYLARALYDVGQRERALELAHESQRVLAANESLRLSEQDELDAWLEKIEPQAAPSKR